MKKTPAEMAAGVEFVDELYLPGDPRRYGAKGDNMTDDTEALNTALRMSQGEDTN